MRRKGKTINHILRECSKVAQKEYNTKHEWVEKVILREWCKRLKFHHTYKWYIHKPESARENETSKILWDFEIQTTHPLSARIPDLLVINKMIFHKKRKLVVEWILPFQRTTERKLKKIERKTNTWTLPENFDNKVSIIPVVIDALETVH